MSPIRFGSLRRTVFRSRRAACRLALLVGATCLPRTEALALAQHSPRSDSVQIAGVAFLSAASNTDSLFPVARAILAAAEGQNTPVTGVMVKAFASAGVPIRTDLATRAGQSLAFAFDDEYQVVDRVRDSYRVITVLSAQLLTIDFRTQQVVSAMPVSFDLTSVSATPPDDAFRARIVRTLTGQFTDTSAAGVFGRAAATFQQLVPAAEGGCLVRIGAVTYAPSTIDAVQTLFGTDTVRLNRSVMSLLGRTWTTTARQALLPNGDSQARGQMQGRFANGEIFNLRIPSADYEIAFADIATKRGIAGQNSAIRVEGVGMQFKLIVTDTELKKPVTGGTFSMVTLDTLSVQLPPTDGWVAVSNTLKSLTAAVGTAARASDRAWLKANDSEKRSGSTLPEWVAKRCGQ